VRKGILYVINKRILDLNKDKDNYGKNSRVDIPKNKRCYSTYLHLWIRKSRAIEVLEKLKLAKIKGSRLE
jgi:geranylgeranyl pyrophosphate synthase